VCPWIVAIEVVGYRVAVPISVFPVFELLPFVFVPVISFLTIQPASFAPPQPEPPSAIERVCVFVHSGLPASPP